MGWRDWLPEGFGGQTLVTRSDGGRGIELIFFKWDTKFKFKFEIDIDLIFLQFFGACD
jgi:hypothetical protein